MRFLSPTPPHFKSQTLTDPTFARGDRPTMQAMASRAAWPLGLSAWTGLVVFGACGDVAQRESPSDAAKHAVLESGRKLSVTELRTLRKDGFLVLDGFLPESILKQARADVDSLKKSKAFQRTEQHSASVRSDEVCWLRENNDNKTEDGLLCVLRRLRSLPFELELAGFCGNKGFLGHQSQEGTEDLKLGVPLDLQLARYPSSHAMPKDDDQHGAARYRAHRDGVFLPAFSVGAFMKGGIAAREITAILYLSEWPFRPKSTQSNPHDGELVLYVGADNDDETGETSKSVVRVPPIGGRLVLFDSKAILHEVKPHFREGVDRLALTIWIGGEHSMLEFLR